MKQEELESMLRQAKHYDEQCEFEQCKSLCNALLAVKNIDNSDERALLGIHTSALLQLSFIHRNLHGDIPAAIDYAKQALALSDSIDDHELAVRSMLRIAWCYIDAKDYTPAEKYLDKALAISEYIDFGWGIAIICMLRGRILDGRKLFDQSIAAYTKAITLLQDIDERYWATDTYLSLGDVYIYGSTNLSLGLECASKALEKAEALGYRRIVAAAEMLIGMVYLELRESEQALQHFQRSLGLFEHMHNKFQMPSTLGHLSMTYSMLGDLHAALEYRMRALAINEELKRPSGVMMDTANIADVYLALGDYDNVLLFAERSLSICREVEYSDVEEAVNRANIGIVHARKDYSGYDPALAEEQLLRSAELLRGINNRSILYQIHEILMKFYADHGRWREAYDQKTLYHTVKDDVQSESAKRKAQGLETERKFAIERATAEATTSLLHKVLPRSIADRLIKGEKVADYFSQVSVLFADIVGFTPIASKMPARKVLGFLNYVFGEFDRIIDKHGCEKIKTIGDGYMAVAGAPILCEDHAERIALAAIEMMGEIQLPEDIRASLPKGSKFNIRIGINSGPAFGGIVGDNRFVYDIYSDAVNMAARMESHGEAGRIHVSEDFAFHLQNRMDMEGNDLGGIVFEERDEIDIKGKGKMKTYFLERV